MPSVSNFPILPISHASVVGINTLHPEVNSLLAGDKEKDDVSSLWLLTQQCVGICCG